VILYFTVTIDTEEDNWGEYERDSYSVENLRRIPRIQEMFTDYGVRPTYLISYPVATSPIAVEVLSGYRERGLCEIGTHPHPWNTPPLDEDRTSFNSYISHLPSGLQYQKIKALHEAIAANFGIAPTTYRSGRWGFSDDVARNLIRLGYTVDTSITPGLDWSEYEGPDYSRSSPEPFTFQMHDSDTGCGSLLEVPATVDFVQRPRAFASSAYRSIRSAIPFGARILGALGRVGILNLVCVSPEINDAPQMIRLAQALVARGTAVINMFFHSPSLLEGCSPYVRTAADLTALLARIDEFLAFVQKAGLRTVTMSELPATGIGASTVKVLPTS
jgi:hypothetical protein